jgi:hypothetical protein
MFDRVLEVSAHLPAVTFLVQPVTEHDVRNLLAHILNAHIQHKYPAVKADKLTCLYFLARKQAILFFGIRFWKLLSTSLLLRVFYNSNFVV